MLSTMNCLVTLIGLAVIDLSSAYPTRTSHNFHNVSYGEVEHFMSLNGYIYHLEADLYRNGSILFSEAYSLKTTDGSSTQIIVGSPSSFGYREGRGTYARFDGITGFYQLNETNVAVAEIHHHCIRMVNRQTRATSQFAGRCGFSGTQDGVGTAARFYVPRKISRDPTNSRSLVVLQGAGTSQCRLRILNIDTRSVTTAVTSGLDFPRAMTWSSNNRALYVSHYYHISKVDWATKRVTRVAGSSQSTPSFGPFNQTRFAFLEELAHLKDNLYIVIDTRSKRLTILDMMNNNSVPLCFKNNCTLNANGFSLLLVNDAVFVGTNSGILKLTGYSCTLRDADVYIKPSQSRATVTIDAAGHTGEFPVGEYKLNFEAGTCPGYTVRVLKNSTAHRIAFKVSYAVRCGAVNNAVGRVLLEPVLRHILVEFQEICRSDCVMSETIKPFYVCIDDVLTITWPTDTVHAPDQSPNNIDTLLKTRLQRMEMRKAKLRIRNNTPQTVLPKPGPNGQSVEVIYNDTGLDKADVCDQKLVN